MQGGDRPRCLPVGEGRGIFSFIVWIPPLRIENKPYQHYGLCYLKYRAIFGEVTPWCLYCTQNVTIQNDRLS